MLGLPGGEEMLRDQHSYTLLQKRIRFDPMNSIIPGGPDSKLKSRQVVYVALALTIEKAIRGHILADDMAFGKDDLRVIVCHKLAHVPSTYNMNISTN